MNRGERRAPGGFTYLELLVTLSIIGLVMSLLFPALLSGREAARRTPCLSNLRQLGTALHLYAMDNGGRFPPEDENWVPILPNTKNSAVFTCPSETGPGKAWNAARTSGPPWPAVSYSSYQYLGGLANDGWSEQPLGADWAAWHMEGGNVLYLDGRARWVPARELPRLSAKLRPHP
jgi:prepilin-type N-terminal cleavage/methylation domain-containing protein/prepilin-type processing-associated H-X9-DG protein